MSEVKKHYWLVIILIALVGINITYPADANVPRFNSNTYESILFALWVILIYMGIIKDKINRILKYDWIIGIIFSTVYCLTFITNGLTNNNYLYSGINLAFTIFSWLSWAVIFTITFTYIRNYFGVKVVNKGEGTPKIIKIWAILSLIWIISIIGFLPGQISWDGLKQFCEFEGTYVHQLGFTYSPTNHHPWFTTVMFGTLFNIGKSLFGVNFGVFTVIIVQFVISSLIYSFVIRYVWMRMGKIGGISTFILFASPIFSSYIVTVDKSTLYYAFSAWFYLCFAKLFEKLKDGKWNYKDILLYTISSTLVGLFRNDAFLIVIIATLLLTLLVLKQKKRLAFILGSLVIIMGIHVGWNNVLNNENVVKSSPSEALTIPMRQLSYVYMTHPNTFTKSELNKINKITALSKIKGKYDINNGDNLKSLFPSDTFLNSDEIIKEVVAGKKTLKTTSSEKKATVDYLKLWFMTGIKYPNEYLKIYLGANSRYLNPFIQYDASLFLNYYPPMPVFLQPSWYKEYHPLFNNNVRNEYRQILSMITMTPPLAIICNPAVLMWISLILLFILLWLRDWKGIGFLLPLLLMCMLFTVVSVNGYTRYTIGSLAVLPIVFTCIWQRKSNLDQMIKEK